MKCVCGYQGNDFIWLSMLQVCTPEKNRDAIRKRLDALEKEATMDIPMGETKRSYACPKCGTLKVEV